MAVEPAVLAPVLSQHGCPIGLTPSKRAALGLDLQDLTRVQERTRDGLCVLGLRFSQDKLSPAARFATLLRALGAVFDCIEIDSSPGNPHSIPTEAHFRPHRQLRRRTRDPTRAALDRVLTFLHERLHGPTNPQQAATAARGGRVDEREQPDTPVTGPAQDFDPIVTTAAATGTHPYRVKPPGPRWVRPPPTERACSPAPFPYGRADQGLLVCCQPSPPTGPDYPGAAARTTAR